MSERPPLTADAVEVFIASLRQRSVPVNTIKSYAHDLHLFVQSVPADLSAVTAKTIQAFLADFDHPPDDLYFLHTIRVDSQRLYCTLVLLWARVERVLLSETESIPETVVKHVSKQLGLAPAVLSQLHNPPSMRSATFEAVRTYLAV